MAHKCPICNGIIGSFEVNRMTGDLTGQCIDCGTPVEISTKHMQVTQRKFADLSDAEQREQDDSAYQSEMIGQAYAERNYELGG
jgi:hypothetical protein